MTTEEHIQRNGQNLLSLTVKQRQLMDLLGMTPEEERRLATRIEQAQEFRLQQEESRARHEEFLVHHDRTMKEIDLKLDERAVKNAEANDKLNALIDYVRAKADAPNK